MAGVYSDHGRPLDPAHPADDARLTAEVRAVAASARRRAVRDGDSQADTAHLLHSLLEYDPEARAACDIPAGRSARVLGYLVQRSIGYGLRWRGSVEDSGALPTLTLTVPGWSPAAAAAFRAALDLAGQRGGAQADGIDLLHALAADPDCRAADVLRSAGLDPDGLHDGPGSVPGPRDVRD
ncbi:Clp protease N-terminal domain-containing protein [Actinacidiphila paucisporea]|uniref:Clp amino terminal domain-containing protein, pathogenicity island component n=1 Tax=Actinacidiphila paucisporea TaxID=310782 RepID=A0A1M7GMG5_9ACTN|nr:Clp protease N-terminal domain-containing protein [Actinacidiphila paucisporea]SHM17355.1 Clp amino terminal domain-containing protein, pathogenicity island component [Actinacidiphila paucisporea]